MRHGPSPRGFSREAQVREMEDSHYCLVFHGDTLSSSRLYTAVASECIPVVVSDGLRAWGAVYLHSHSHVSTPPQLVSGVSRSFSSSTSKKHQLTSSLFETLLIGSSLVSSETACA